MEDDAPLSEQEQRLVEGLFTAITTPYIRQRAAQLVRQMDWYNSLTVLDRNEATFCGAFSPHEWIGRATEILREVARDV